MTTPSDELAAMRERKREAYYERNKVVAMLARCFPSGIRKTNIEGWDPKWHGCVYIELPTGQVSWHYHDDHAHLFAHLLPFNGEYDGHSTEEKYRRLAAYRPEKEHMPPTVALRRDAAIRVLQELGYRWEQDGLEWVSHQYRGAVAEAIPEHVCPEDGPDFNWLAPEQPKSKTMLYTGHQMAESFRSGVATAFMENMDGLEHIIVECMARAMYDDAPRGIGVSWTHFQGIASTVYHALCGRLLGGYEPKRPMTPRQEHDRKDREAQAVRMLQDMGFNWNAEVRGWVAKTR